MDTKECLIGRNDIAAKIDRGELHLYDKTTSRGRIWRIFARVTKREGAELDFVCCKICQKICKYNHAQTSNLCRHSCYVDTFSNAENEVSVLDEERPRVQFIEVKANNLTQLLTKWIIQNCHSCDLIQSEGLTAVFQEFVKLGAKFGTDLDVGKLLPSLSQLSHNISDIYNRLLVTIKGEITLVKENGFGLAADIFTDNLSKINYIALTVHYLKNSALTYRLLGLRIIEGESISNGAASLKRILQNFDLQLSNKCLFVTYGSLDIVKFLQDSQLVPCISHLLNNAVLEAVGKIPEISQIINSCFALVNFLSQKDSNDLCSKLSHKSHRNHSLTIHELLNSVVINFHEINQVLQDTNETQNFALNKNKLVAIVGVLQPFKEAIETLEDDGHATLHLVVAYMHELRKFCQTSTVDDYTCFSCIQQLRVVVCLNLEKIEMQNVTTVHKVAVFLYPPTNKLLPYSDKEKQAIEDECVRLMKYHRNDTHPLLKQEPDEQQLLASFSKRRKLLNDFLESDTHYDADELMRQEIQNYKNIRAVLTPSFNVFNWWQVQKHNFPLLYKLSCTVLATPATSSVAKQVLSNTTNLLSEKYRQNSHPADIEKITFISTNASGLELDRYLAT